MNLFNFKWILLLLIFISPPVFSQMNYSISSIQYEFTDGENSIISTVGVPIGIPIDSDSEFISGLVVSPEFSIISGLNEQNLDKIIIYPNPVDSYLYFDHGSNMISSVVIFDLMGNTVFASKKIKVNNIDVKNFPPGIYKILLMGNNNKIIQSASILKN